MERPLQDTGSREPSTGPGEGPPEEATFSYPGLMLIGSSTERQYMSNVSWYPWLTPLVPEGAVKDHCTL